MSAKIELIGLKGKHFISGIGFSFIEKNDEYLKKSKVVDIIIDNQIVSAIADSRKKISCLNEVVLNRPNFKIKYRFDPIESIGIFDVDKGQDVISFYDVLNGEKILSFGTGHTDKGIPFFISEWNPENIHT